MTTYALLALSVLLLATSLLSYTVNRRRSRNFAQLLQQANERLHHVATHDGLTGLPNRTLLSDRLEQAIAQAERDGGSFALLIVDLDRFKSINNSLGHQAGDHLLAVTAQQLRSTLRRSDTLARLGGDEFVIILSDVNGPAAAAGVIDEILSRVGRPTEIATLQIQTSPSIGVSIYPNDGTDSHTLLRHAQAAMCHAKRCGGNSVQFFIPAMNEFTRDRLQLESELRGAVGRGELELHYQPKVDIRSGQIVSCEALVRWNHPARGLLGPAEFIPLAEESGLILPIGEWVLYEACRQARAWHDNGILNLRMAVNLSAQQFREKDLVTIVQSALRQAGLEARFLEVELTETAMVADARGSASILRELSALGVRISIDDFGTGYSSLSHLQRFPVDKLKIDRAFVREIGRSCGDTEIVRAIVSLAHNLRLVVIAEGVERLEQLEFLTEIGCDQYQGYYCSPALSATSVEAMIKGRLANTQPSLDLSLDTYCGRSPVLGTGGG